MTIECQTKKLENKQGKEALIESITFGEMSIGLNKIF